MKVKAPCLDCPDREILCHSKCIKYKNFRDELDKIKEREFKINKLRSDIYYLANKRRNN